MPPRSRDWRLPDGPYLIDWANPITEGLVLATDGQLRDMVARGPSTTVTGTKPQATAFGGRVRGFGATYGVGSTDSVVTGLTSHANQRTYAIWAVRNGAGGGSGGRYWEKRTSGAVVEALQYSASPVNPSILYGRGWSGSTGGIATWTAPGGAPNAVELVGLSYDSTSSANNPSIYVNGLAIAVSPAQLTSGTLVNNTDAFVLGNRTNDNARTWDGMLGYFLVWDRLLSAAEHYALFAPGTRREWMLQAKGRSLVALVSATSISGALTATLGTLTSTATAVLPILGQTTATLGALTSTAVGVLPIAGTSTVTLGSLTSTATGVLALQAAATVTLGALTSVATGAVAIIGSLTTTLGSLTSTAAGALALVGSATVTLGTLTSTATGALALVGQSTVTLGELTVIATGGSGVAGSLTATLGELTSTATGVLSLAASATVTLGALTSTVTGVLPLTAAATVTLGVLTSTATGSLAVLGALTVTLGALTVVATGMEPGAVSLWPEDTYPASVAYARLRHTVTYTPVKHRVTFDG